MPSYSPPPRATHDLSAGRQFWPNDISLADTQSFPNLPGSKRLTDYYLLALAVKNGGSLATLDAKIDSSMIPGGPSAYYLIRNS